MDIEASRIFQALVGLGEVPYKTEELVYGNLLEGLGFQRAPGCWTLNPEAPILLTAHLDTVHLDLGEKGYVLREGIARGVGHMGADDKAGVALILYLFRRLSPIVGFVLFEGEEVGRVGAGQAREAGLFRSAKAMISLDRRGTTEVIYAQMGQPTASLEFAQALADGLGMGHKPSPHGVVTDSFEFAPEIPECLNLAVGYENPHRPQDRQNLEYLDRLAEALLAMDWEGLLGHVRRKPEEEAF